MAEVVVHVDPVWREAANFLIAARLPDDLNPARWEQVWARQLTSDQFEVCCIPFFVRNVDLGDHVTTVKLEEKPYVINGVLKKSGRFTFRAWLSGASDQAKVDLVKRLLERGCLTEWYSSNLLAIDAATELLAQEVGAFLALSQERGYLEFETGRTR